MANSMYDIGIIDKDSGNKLTRIEEVLINFKTGVPDIEGVVVVTQEGLPIASIIDASVDEDRVAAMTAASLSLAERVSSELDRGELNEIMIKGIKGFIIMMNAGEAVLTGITRSKAKLGLVLLEMKRAANKIAKVF
ncbi:MAG: roadblock/LC7 domain-containing protein [Candidatus Hodarchaeales archaeon]|jgi:predicted regulator of Ras-like GTPase activity (Roadblock/LC7/MglB family)